MQSAAKRYNMNFFPSMKLFKQGRPHDFNLGRLDSDSVAGYTRYLTGPASRVLNSSEVAAQTAARYALARDRGLFTARIDWLVSPLVAATRSLTPTR